MRRFLTVLLTVLAVPTVQQAAAYAGESWT